MIPLKQIYAVQKLVMEPDIKIPNPTYVTQIPRSTSVLEGLPLLSFDTKLLPAGSATPQTTGRTSDLYQVLLYTASYAPDGVLKLCNLRAAEYQATSPRSMYTGRNLDTSMGRSCTNMQDPCIV